MLNYFASSSFLTLTASSVAASFDTFASKHPASFAISSSLDGNWARVVNSSTVEAFPSNTPPLIL